MIEMIQKLKKKAGEIADIKLYEIIPDVDLLAVALSAVSLKEIAQTIMVSHENECKHTAAHKALDIGWNPTLRAKKLREGYFSEGLKGLIELSKQDPDIATRLMPVLAVMVGRRKEFGISKKLKGKAMRYMKSIYNRDGFAIANIDDDGHVEVQLHESILVKRE